MIFPGCNRTARLLCAAVISACAICGCVPPDETGSQNERPPLPPPDETLNELLAFYDERYDDTAGLVAEGFVSVGYHSQLPTGARVFPTRESLVYAIALLRRNEEGDAARAARIVKEVLTTQDADPNSPTFGVWPWHANEPIAEMSSPDLNWADFCGAALAQLLIDHADQLPTQLKDELRQGLRRATTAIRKRNVGPGYTNIAILGAGVCVAAGELFGDDSLIAYGRERLEVVVGRTADHGPADGVFSATDLRVRYELIGNNVKADELGDGRFTLMAGKHHVVIHTCPGRLGDHEVVWQLGHEDDRVYVDGIAYRGEERDFDFSKPIDLELAAGIELLAQNEPIAQTPPVVGRSGNSIETTWRPEKDSPPLTVETPVATAH